MIHHARWRSDAWQDTSCGTLTSEPPLPRRIINACARDIDSVAETVHARLSGANGAKIETGASVLSRAS